MHLTESGNQRKDGGILKLLATKMENDLNLFVREEGGELHV